MSMAAGDNDRDVPGIVPTNKNINIESQMLN